MARPGSDRRSRRSGAARFATTHWSVVLAAGQCAAPESRAALATLCQAYWYPLYAFVRRQGFDPDAAQDLTQEFFARLFEKNSVATADPLRGRFRAFLLATLRHFLANQRDRRAARKRGGDRAILSLDFQVAEDRYRLEPADTMTPDRVFERRWALTLLEQVLAQLRSDYERTGKGTSFDRLKPFLSGEADAGTYAEAAVELGTSEGAVKVAVHRLRRRYRELLRAQIAQTVAEPADIDDEIRDLFSALGS